VTALTVRVPNWIGDCIMALPALQALHAAGLELHCVGRGWAPALLAGTGLAVTELPRKLRPGACHLRSLPGRDAVLMTHSLSSAAMMRLAGKRALGYARDGRSLLLSARLPWPHGMHESRRYWRLANTMCQRLGLPPLATDPPHCELALTAEARAAGAAALQTAQADAQANSQAVVLCPVATGTVHGVDKHWPHFTALAAHLVAAGQRPVVVAPPGQRETLAASYPGCAIVGDLAIDVWAGLLAAADTVVANDSGPMHVACAVGTRSVIPFAVTDPAITGAWSPQLVAIRGDGGWPMMDRLAAAL
jgi:heptosyltransferase-2